MPEAVIPQKVQLVVKRGFERMQRYKKATTMFTKEFVGQYYRDAKGMRGEEPINLIFATIRSWVPNLVMQNPVNLLSTEIKDQRAYGELLGLSVDRVEKEIKLKKTLRAWIVSALFGLGIIKTSIAASGVSLQFGDINIDPGQVYAELVSLDNFVIDPVCTDLSKSSFYGDRITVPRQMLLDTDGYDHDLVRKLPTSKTPDVYQKESLTKQSTSVSEFNTLQDNVDVVVDEYPALAQLRKSGLRRSETLLGLYEGVPQTRRGSHYGMVLPDKITIFQKPIEANCRSDAGLYDEVSRVLKHEIAHHFGISDARLREIEKE